MTLTENERAILECVQILARARGTLRLENYGEGFKPIVIQRALDPGSPLAKTSRGTFNYYLHSLSHHGSRRRADCPRQLIYLEGHYFLLPGGAGIPVETKEFRFLSEKTRRRFLLSLFWERKLGGIEDLLNLVESPTSDLLAVVSSGYDCPYCGSTDSRFVIHHQHETGEPIRLICDPCNRAEGHNPRLFRQLELAYTIKSKPFTVDTSEEW